MRNTRASSPTIRKTCINSKSSCRINPNFWANSEVKTTLSSGRPTSQTWSQSLSQYRTLTPWSSHTVSNRLTSKSNEPSRCLTTSRGSRCLHHHSQIQALSTCRVTDMRRRLILSWLSLERQRGHCRAGARSRSTQPAVRRPSSSWESKRLTTRGTCRTSIRVLTQRWATWSETSDGTSKNHKDKWKKRMTWWPTSRHSKDRNQSPIRLTVQMPSVMSSESLSLSPWSRSTQPPHRAY